MNKIEQSIQKKFRKRLWRPFIEGIRHFGLIEENDRIAVCISGGKDSMLLAKLMQLLCRFSDFPISAEFIVMNPGYNAKDLDKIISNAEALEIPISIFVTDIFKIAGKSKESPCYLCARMRRGHLYKQAQNLNCNKIALGHHLSDVITTSLMGMLYNAKLDLMPPVRNSKNFPGMKLIRPMICIEEDAIIAWRDYNRLSFVGCGCPLAERKDGISRRSIVGEIVHELKKKNPLVEQSLFKALYK